MSSKEYATPLRLELRPSQLLSRCVVMMHLFVLALSVFGPFAVWQKLLLTVLILCGWLYHQRRYPLGNNRRRVQALVWHREGNWEIERQGIIDVARMGPEAFVLPRLVILQLRPQAGGRLYLAILPDMLDMESFRQLRVRLRMAGNIT